MVFFTMIGALMGYIMIISLFGNINTHDLTSSLMITLYIYIILGACAGYRADKYILDELLWYIS